jgi:hypothetical protein
VSKLLIHLVLADYLADFLKNHPDVEKKLSRKGVTRFFVSDKSAQIEKTAKRLFRKNLSLEQVTCYEYIEFVSYLFRRYSRQGNPWIHNLFLMFQNKGSQSN